MYYPFNQVQKVEGLNVAPDVQLEFNQNLFSVLPHFLKRSSELKEKNSLLQLQVCYWPFLKHHL